jgi:hypothetical protein
MSLRSTAKRWTYLVHRWLGIGGCLLMLLWFVSGMVMLFIGYPKLTPGERLAALPVLGEARDLQGCRYCLAAVQAEPEAVALTTLRGEPAYVVRSGSNVGAWSRDRPGAAAGVGTARRSIRCTVRRRPGLRVRRAWMRTAGRIRAHWMRIGRCIGSRWAARSRGPVCVLAYR